MTHRISSLTRPDLLVRAADGIDEIDDEEDEDDEDEGSDDIILY